MARLYDTVMKDLPQIWTVEKPVGRGCSNPTVDVYLIQFFLQKVVHSPAYPPIYVPPASWEVNGTWQESMHRAIELFQLFLYKAGADERLPQLVNGRVDPVVNVHSSGSQLQGSLNSTMIYLNRCMRLQYKLLFDNLLTAREVPSYLHFALLKEAQAHLKRGN
jgi:hypothetical protein